MSRIPSLPLLVTATVSALAATSCGSCQQDTQEPTGGGAIAAGTDGEVVFTQEGEITAASEHIGAALVQRFDVKKGRDWGFGSLALVDVWRDEFNEVVKYTTWYATGDSTGFPVVTWEVTERNPELEITIPG